MAYTIGNECINCGHCKGRCPQKAISKGTDTHIIDAQRCVECGMCLMVCPVGAPFVQEKNAVS